MILLLAAIDYGVMEHAKNIYVLTSSFGWDDVGSWLAVERIRPQDEFSNVIDGRVVPLPYPQFRGLSSMGIFRSSC